MKVKAKKPSETQKIRPMIVDRMSKHKLSKAKSYTRKFANPDSWNYGFFVTWYPGGLHISGDIGELSFTHYHACPTLDHALFWFDNAGTDYLLGKSNAKRVMDEGSTLRFIAEQKREQECEEEKSKYDDLLNEIRGSNMTSEDVASAIYQSNLFPDWYGSTKWDPHAVSQCEAMKLAIGEWIYERHGTSFARFKRFCEYVFSEKFLIEMFYREKHAKKVRNRA